ncbi:MAG: autotransporter domain-containing protein [Deltaproteobacteria bacterium]|jgi:hypothetical protein|nr:autotransporter domain-containing protein [Deltaproteobacteria bacterium]
MNKLQTPLRPVFSCLAVFCFCLGIALAALPALFPQPAFAGQEFTIEGLVNGSVSGNSSNPDHTWIYPDTSALLPDSNGNKVTIASGGEVLGDVDGADVLSSGDSDATATKNEVTVKNGGTVGGGVYGAYATSEEGDATASENTVTIGGTATGTVYGGNAYSDNSAATANANEVTISGTASGDVYGGDAESDGNATANDNEVTISGTAGYDVYGGEAYSSNGNATANDNKVAVSGTVNNAVYGGYADSHGSGKHGEASRNSVTISGTAKVGGNIYGGYSLVDIGVETGSATHNIITIESPPEDTFDLTASSIYGGFVDDGSGSPVDGMDAFTGNTLNLKTSGIEISGLYNFENLNFYLPTDLAADGVMLTVHNEVNIVGSKIAVGINGGTSALNLGDTVVLLQTSGLSADQGGTTAQGIQGISRLYDFDLIQEGDSLLATAIAAKANDQLKALSEGRLAALAFLNQGADLVMGPGLYAALQAAQAQNSRFAHFAIVSGGTSRYDTGSHIDVDGASLVAGLAYAFPLEPQNGSLVAGAFFETGLGGYDSYNSFDNAASVKGDGDLSYYGVGIMARYAAAGLQEGQIAQSGLYAEASLRAGQVDTDFSSDDILNGTGNNTEYDSGSAYYGAHLGAGYVWVISEKSSLDFSAKYIWTHMDSDSVTIAGDNIKFKAMDSQRLRAGARYSYMLNEYVTPYLGAYYDHEFSAKAKGKANGDSFDAPDLKGGTGVGEIGLSFKPSQDFALTFDLAMQGYTGVREGVSGSLQVKFEF